MAKEKFERQLYVGPTSSFSVVTHKGKDKEPESDDRPLITGSTYDDLPQDHPIIQNLVAHELLIPAPDDTAEAPSKTAGGDSDNDKGGDDRSASAKTSEKGKTK